MKIISATFASPMAVTSANRKDYAIRADSNTELEILGDRFLKITLRNQQHTVKLVPLEICVLEIDSASADEYEYNFKNNLVNLMKVQNLVDSNKNGSAKAKKAAKVKAAKGKTRHVD